MGSTGRRNRHASHGPVVVLLVGPANGRARGTADASIPIGSGAALKVLVNSRPCGRGAQVRGAEAVPDAHTGEVGSILGSGQPVGVSGGCVTRLPIAADLTWILGRTPGDLT